MPRDRRRGRIVAAPLLAGALLVAGCTTGGSATGNAGGASTDTIRGWWSTDPTTFSPPNTTAIDDYRAMRLGFDTLLRRDLDGQLIAGLAESWKQDGANVTLTIAEGRTCADGTPITASVVADSLAYFADPKTGAPAARAVFGKGQPKVTADDEASVVSIALSQPHSDILAGLTIPQSGVVCPDGLQDKKGLAAGTVEGAFSGPYVIKKATPGVRYDYELRQDYDGWPEYSQPLKGTPAQNLRFEIGAPNAVANQLVASELDVAPIETADFERFEDKDGFKFVNAITGEHYIMFNQRKTSPFRDEELRRAAAQVINRAALRDAINPYTAELIPTLGTKNMQCASTNKGLLVKPDMTAASKVLDGVKVRVIGSNTVGKNGASTVYVQERLRAAGADVELTNLDVGTWITRVYDEPASWDITVMGTVNNMASISWGLGTVIGPHLSEGGRNVSYADTLEANKAFEAAQRADSEDVCKHYAVAQQAALEAVDFIPISTISRPLIARDGFDLTSPGGREDLTTLRILA